MASPSLTQQRQNELGRTFSLAAPGLAGMHDSAPDRNSDRILDHLLALAMEIYRRIDRRAAAGLAAHRARFLRAGRDRTAKPARQAVSIVVRASVAVHLRG